MNHRDLMTTERIALVSWALLLGKAYTTREVAELTGLTWGGAYRMLCRMSRVLPLYQHDDGRWGIFAINE